MTDFFYCTLQKNNDVKLEFQVVDGWMVRV